MKMFNKKEQEKIFYQFTKFRNEFIFCKKVLGSCTTKDQVTNTNKWFKKVICRWLEDLDNFKERQGYSCWERLYIAGDMRTFVREICREWDKLVTEKYREIKKK